MSTKYAAGDIVDFELTLQCPATAIFAYEHNDGKTSTSPAVDLCDAMEMYVNFTNFLKHSVVSVILDCSIWCTQYCFIGRTI